MLTVPGRLAEFERALIRTRTGEGRARAVARGQKMGRPPKLTPHHRREAIKSREQGETLADIGRSYNRQPGHDFPSHAVLAKLAQRPPHSALAAICTAVF
jgi:hypothetical protein